MTTIKVVSIATWKCYKHLSVFKHWALLVIIMLCCQYNMFFDVSCCDVMVNTYYYSISDPKPLFTLCCHMPWLIWCIDTFKLSKHCTCAVLINFSIMIHYHNNSIRCTPQCTVFWLVYKHCRNLLKIMHCVWWLYVGWM